MSLLRLKKVQLRVPVGTYNWCCSWVKLCSFVTYRPAFGIRVQFPVLPIYSIFNQRVPALAETSAVLGGRKMEGFPLGRRSLRALFILTQVVEWT